MKPITMYEADDGSRWETEEKALERDELVAECAAQARSLKDIPLGTGFGSGDGYLQQPSGSRQRLVDWLMSKGWNRDSDGPIGRLGYRVHSMDGQDREWGQPYFAINPSKGKQVEVGA